MALHSQRTGGRTIRPSFTTVPLLVFFHSFHSQGGQSTRDKGQGEHQQTGDQQTEQHTSTYKKQRQLQRSSKCIPMEDNSLESLPSPSTTSTTPTTTTANTTTTTSTNNTRLSIAEHAATTNTAATDHGSECQQQPDQLAAAPANKRHHDPPYDWQLLSQEELDRIAYNSRRQTKARQRVCLH